MRGHLGSGGEDVHARAAEVLRFWFEESTHQQRFGKDPAFDDLIRDRFGALRDLVLGSGAAEWRDDPGALLAAVVLLDQFSRNIHRGEGQAFAGDPLAQQLAIEAIDRAWDLAMPEAHRLFLYMPLEHAEDGPLQALSIERMATLEDAECLRYAREHAEVIARFGRFPSRNAALGRVSTPEEVAYLEQPGVGW